MRYVNPNSYDTADDFWDAVQEELDREDPDAREDDDE